MTGDEALRDQAEAVAGIVAELRATVARLERANRGLVMFILRDHPDADLKAITEGGAE